MICFMYYSVCPTILPPFFLPTFTIFNILLFNFSLVKTTFEDVFPAEATTVEEYLQQVIHCFRYPTTIYAFNDKNNLRGKILLDLPY